MQQQKTIAVTGATGQIGHRIVLALLAQGHAVRALTRDAAKARDLAAKGATVLVGAPEDAAYLARAFDGADAVFAMTPPHYGAPDFRAHQNLVGRAIADALVQAKVRKVVHLSSIGANNSAGVGVVNGLNDQERRLDALPEIDVVHLRPAYFMENLFFALALIREQGIVGTPARADAVFPQIATADIADAATTLLAAADFTGKRVVELLGERDLTMAEVTRVVADAAGKPLTYVQFPYDAARDAMVQGGLSPSAAEGMIELYRAVNEGQLMRPVEPRSARSTTRTSIEEFARGFAAAVTAS